MIMQYNVDKRFWQSKKWWSALIATIVPIINQVFSLGWNVDEISRIIIPMVIFIIGQSWVDGQAVKWGGE